MTDGDFEAGTKVSDNERVIHGNLCSPVFKRVWATQQSTG
jgi:hypothetical protein